MPELDLNYDLPWLQQKPDSNQPMSLAEAFQLRQHQQQIDAQKALLPLRQQEMQAQIAGMSLDHQIKQEKLQTALDIQASSAGIWGQISKTDWLDQKSVGELYGTIAQKGGNVDPQALQLIEKSVQGAQIYSAKQAATEARAESIRDTLKTREMLSDAAIQAANDRTSAVNTSREKIAQDALVARANLEVVKQNNRLTLESGKTVKWPEFLNRHLKSYTDATGKTPEEAAKLLRVLYDENVGVSAAQPPAGITGDPKDPWGLFKVQPQ